MGSYSGGGEIRVATLKDVKASGTAGGAAVATTWTDRDLNTLNDPDSIITSLSSNKFTLPAGKYLVEMCQTFYKTSYTYIGIFGDGSTGRLMNGPLMVNAGVTNSNAVTFSCLLDLSVAEGFTPQYFANTSHSAGLGDRGGTSGGQEEYTSMVVTKL